MPRILTLFTSQIQSVEYLVFVFSSSEISIENFSPLRLILIFTVSIFPLPFFQQKKKMFKIAEKPLFLLNAIYAKFLYIYPLREKKIKENNSLKRVYIDRVGNNGRIDATFAKFAKFASFKTTFI